MRVAGMNELANNTDERDGSSIAPSSSTHVLLPTLVGAISIILGLYIVLAHWQYLVSVYPVLVCMGAILVQTVYQWCRTVVCYREVRHLISKTPARDNLSFLPKIVRLYEAHVAGWMLFSYTALLLMQIVLLLFLDRLDPRSMYIR
jgi:hypothetical protein